MQCSQGKQAGPGAIRGQFPQICHFTGKLPQPLCEITSDGCPVPWKSSWALSPGSWRGEGGNSGDMGIGAVTHAGWLVHFLTFCVGLRNCSCLLLEGLEIHNWGFRRLWGRRPQGFDGRQWFRFEKLLMLINRLFLWVWIRKKQKQKQKHVITISISWFLRWNWPVPASISLPSNLLSSYWPKCPDQNTKLIMSPVCCPEAEAWLPWPDIHVCTPASGM